MGRKIKRVDANFDWPINKTWQGYIRPESLDGDPCPDCQGGQTHAGWWLQHMCQRLSMLAIDVGEQERGRPLHPWLEDDPYPHTDSTHLFMHATRVIRPSADMADLVAGLTGQPVDRVKGSFGSSDYKIYRKIAEAAGIPDFGTCTTCDGEGTLEKHPGQRAAAALWEPTEPPEGEGWQLWETVSEGSPISPVFPDAAGLIEWMTTPAAEWGAMGPWTREQADAFVRGPGWAPTFIGGPGGLVDDVTAVSGG